MHIEKRYLTALSVISIFILLYSNHISAAKFDVLDVLPSTDGVYYTFMVINGDCMAIGDGRQPGVGIDIINISNPYDLRKEVHIHTGHMTYQLDWVGNFIYAPASWDGFYIYDVTDFNDVNLVFVDSSFNYPVTAAVVRDNYVLVGGDLGSRIFDIADPYNPQMVWDSDNLVFCRMVTGNHIAYTFQWATDVTLYDISRPDRLLEISRFDFSAVNSVDVSPDERYVYFTNWRQGLYVYDVIDPYSPLLISQTPTPNNAICIYVCVSGLKLNQEIVYVSGYTGGLWAFDVSDPYHPYAMASYFPPTQCHDIISKQDLVFLSSLNCLISLRFDPTTDIDDSGNELPKDLFSSINYPNPFNDRTTIRYFLPDESDVLVEIYNHLGQKLETLLDGSQAPGYHTGNWNADGYSSGIYYYRINTSSGSVTRKITLLK